MKGEALVKENTLPQAPLSPWWLVTALVATGVSLLLIARIDYALPEPLTRSAPPDRFIAEIAHEHLVNLTSIGPRVAGSYENEVLGVGVVVEAVKRIAAEAAPHHRIELDLHLASGAFPLKFLDGMNNVYKDVSSVVVRLSAAGERPARSALLLNCHIDSVPDSPGASDDGAGCAVLLETLRALAASGAPLRHDALFLLNGAEENILQASHGFVTQHRWAAAARAFLNVEACGAGGREVLFQAGPHDPWLVEQYAASAPHPFASSLAQELFQSGLIPADTDFRIFRDFGGMSGVDFAWSSNGYVYHTLLDTAERVSPAVLQRTGDNVLALARGLLVGEQLDSPRDPAARQPVFFDVLGVTLVSARAPVALAAVAVTLALVALDLHLSARLATRRLGVRGRVWARAVWGGAGAALGAYGAGAGAAAASGLLLHAAGARMAWFAQPALLVPLFAAPALAAGGAAGARLCPTPAGGARGWWRPRAVHQGALAVAASVMTAMVLAGMRSSFLPLLWVALPALADVLALLTSAEMPALWWAAGAALPMLETWYLSVGSLRMFVPVAGRAGATVGGLPTDVSTVPLRRRLDADDRRHDAYPCADGDWRARGGADPGRQQLAAAPRRRHAEQENDDHADGADVGGGGGGGAGHPPVLGDGPAAADGVPHAAHRARARRRPDGPHLLGARDGRQHGAHARRLRVGRAGGGRGAVRALGVLRRALLPAGAGAAAGVAVRAGPAAPRHHARRRVAAPRVGAGVRADGGGGRAGARRGGGGAGGGRGADVLLGGGAAAGGGVGLTRRVLLLAVPRARRGPVARGAGAARGRRGAGALGAGVGGGPQPVRRAQAGGGARGAAGAPAALGGAHGLGRRPASLRGVARCVSFL